MSSARMELRCLPSSQNGKYILKKLVIQLNSQITFKTKNV